MTRSVLPAEDCVFRLDSAFGYRQQFPMTFNDVGLSKDGFKFNGSSSHIKANKDVWMRTPAYTVEAIIKPDFLSENDYVGIVNFSSNDRRILVSNSGNLLSQNKFVSGDIDMGASVFDTSKSDIYHVVVSINSEFIKMYVDDELISTTETNSEILTYGNDLYIGWGHETIYHYSGNILTVSIYSRALTAQEVSDRYRKLTFQFKNETSTPTQQKYIDMWDNRTIGRQ
jgi:hypothetical protein